MVLEKQNKRCKNLKLDIYLIFNTKIEFMWIKDLEIQSETIRTPIKSIGKTL